MQPPSPRATVKRLPERGRYDQAIVHEVLDQAMICHVAFVFDDAPVVIPTIHARAGGILYLHGSPASRMMRSIVGAPVCVAATIVDGIVAARSLFHHSLNYRSVVIFGTARVVEDPEERMTAFRAITEHMLPGRWEEARPPSVKEDKGTKLLAIDIDEASVKVRTGPPGDDDGDLASDIWAGVIPLRVVAGPVEPSPDLTQGIDVPESVRRYGDVRPESQI